MKNRPIFELHAFCARCSVSGWLLFACSCGRFIGNTGWVECTQDRLKLQQSIAVNLVLFQDKVLSLSPSLFFFSFSLSFLLSTGFSSLLQMSVKLVKSFSPFARRHWLHYTFLLSLSLLFNSIVNLQLHPASSDTHERTEQNTQKQSTLPLVFHCITHVAAVIDFHCSLCEWSLSLSLSSEIRKVQWVSQFTVIEGSSNLSDCSFSFQWITCDTRDQRKNVDD